MKMLVALLLMQFSFANPTYEQICSDAITMNGNHIMKDNLSFYKGSENTYLFGTTRKDGHFINVSNSNGEYYIQMSSRPNDIKEDDKYIYALTNNHIHKINKDNGEVKLLQTTKSAIVLKHHRAAELEIIGDKIYIAHGSLELVIMNKNNGEILDQKYFELPHAEGHISRMTGLAKWDDKLIFVFDNVTYDFNTRRRAFEGVVFAKLSTLKQIKATSIKWKREALHEPTLNIVDGKLFSQNLEIIFKYDLSKIMKDKYFWPERRYHFINKSNFLGRPMIDQGMIKGCFSTYEPNTDSISANYNEISL